MLSAMKAIILMAIMMLSHTRGCPAQCNIVHCQVARSQCQARKGGPMGVYWQNCRHEPCCSNPANASTCPLINITTSESLLNMFGNFTEMSAQCQAYSRPVGWYSGNWTAFARLLQFKRTLLWRSVVPNITWFFVYSYFSDWTDAERAKAVGYPTNARFPYIPNQPHAFGRSASPTRSPSAQPSTQPSAQPSAQPSRSPIQPTSTTSLPTTKKRRRLLQTSPCNFKVLQGSPMPSFFLSSFGGVVGNQQECSSCWAFASASSAQISRGYQVTATGQQTGALNQQASVQEILDCSGGGNCTGGYPADSFAWMTSQSSLCLDGGYPVSYNGTKGQCEATTRCSATSSQIIPPAFQCFESTPRQMELALEYGSAPVIGMTVPRSFFNYGGGIFQCDPNDVYIGGHAVVLVGHGYDPKHNLSYWRIKNSWSSCWGDNGYANIDKNTAQHCKMYHTWNGVMPLFANIPQIRCQLELFSQPGFTGSTLSWVRLGSYTLPGGFVARSARLTGRPNCTAVVYGLNGSSLAPAMMITRSFVSQFSGSGRKVRLWERSNMSPSFMPTLPPSSAPSGGPTSTPSRHPTSIPSATPSQQPSSTPSRGPTSAPSRQPTSMPSLTPSQQPTSQPTLTPTSTPTAKPTQPPSRKPTSLRPTAFPTQSPFAQKQADQKCKAWAGKTWQFSYNVNSGTGPACPNSAPQARADNRFHNVTNLHQFWPGQFTSSDYSCAHNASGPCKQVEAFYTRGFDSANKTIVLTCMYRTEYSNEPRLKHPWRQQGYFTPATYDPILQPALYHTHEGIYRQYCCQYSNNCQLFYQYRPYSTDTYTAPGTCSTWGEPHIKTLDGFSYLFNGLGMYNLLMSSSLVVQCRFEKAGMNIRGSVTTGLVFQAKLGNEWTHFQVEISDNATLPQKLFRVFVNSTSGETLRNDTELEWVFGNSNTAMVLLETEDVKIQYQTQHQELDVWFPFLQFSAKIYFRTPPSMSLVPSIDYSFQLGNNFANRVSGMMGNFNGNKHDDLQWPNGTILPSNSNQRQIFQFVTHSFQVTGKACLFAYGQGKNASSYIDEAFEPVFMTDFQNCTHLELPAQKACDGFQECIFDAAVTCNLQVGLATLDFGIREANEEKLLRGDGTGVTVKRPRSVAWIVVVTLVGIACVCGSCCLYGRFGNSGGPVSMAGYQRMLSPRVTEMEDME